MIIPEAFKPYRQFVLWKTLPGDPDPIKTTIHPITLTPHDAHDSSIHINYDQAVEYLAQGHNIGFVFTKHDPFFFLDIDDCLQPNGEWSPLAVQLCQMFPGCFMEISVSGNGLHVFGSGIYPEHGKRNVQLNIEFYTELRFVALTGTSATGCASVTHQESINYLIDNYFPASAVGEMSEWTTTPVNEWRGIEDDDELIEKFMSSRSAAAILGSRASIQDLWTANIINLSQIYPHPTNPFDYSHADAALCQHLAFWTGKDCERIDRLMRRSGLFREKWDRRESTYGTYGRRTILGAISRCKKVYGERKQLDQAAVSAGINYREGFQYKPTDQQVDYFRGCVYIRDLHVIFTPDGGLLKPEQFRAVYGGFVFALDTINDKVTKNAWEAFTENQGVNFPKVHTTCFRPELPSGYIIEEEGRTLVNTYVPIATAMAEGDISPFIKHLEIMLPDPEDREILISYMAACIQFPGVKFQWCPLIQGCEGNGKTFFISALAHAIGHRYTHLPNAADMGGNGSKFNSWIQNKLFIGVEEIRVSDKREISDALKPLITNPRIEIQGKGANQVTGDNRANFVMCSNHKDAVMKNKNDRRYCILFTAQQCVEDMIKCGIYSNGYFPRLYEWAKSGGYAIISHYLKHFQIRDQYNPATLCDRAPNTSSTTEAIMVSRGGIEQEILEAVSEQRPGFRKGWISSMAFNKLLKDRRDDKRIPINKRKDLLYDLGFIYHPNLKDGRVNAPIIVEGGKPRLYIRIGHINCNIENHADIVQKYMQDQGYLPPDPARQLVEYRLPG